MSLKQAYYSDYKINERKRKIIIGVVSVIALFAAVIVIFFIIKNSTNTTRQSDRKMSLSDFTVPKYTGSLSVEVNNNIPFFYADELIPHTFEQYSQLDILGRCGTAFACLSTDTMPTEERGQIGMVKPSGWHTVRYDDIIDDKYLYNRCHLIAYSLAGENANELNLITGTRNMNVYGMLPYETRTSEYIEKTGNHVLYRVTPYFENSNLVATGVLMEAQSIEDDGRGLMFNVFVFNVQPGIVIDYRTGESRIE